jgi:hypothetical protein
MSSVQTVVSVNITAQTTTPTKPGFGIIMIAGYFTNWTGTDVVRQYSDLDGLVSDGFATTSSVYLAAQAQVQQSPHPEYFYVGKLATAPTPSYNLKCLSAVEGAKYSIQVGTNAATTYTVPAAATTTTVALAISALLAALTGYAASPSTDTITLTRTSGTEPIRLQNWTQTFSILNTTPDSGSTLSADLTAIKVQNSAWYGLVLAEPSKAYIGAASTWAEANKKLLLATTSDSAAMDPSASTDAGSVAQAASYKFTNISFHGTDTLGYRGAAIGANRFVDVPGSDTWKFKNLPGQVVDNLTDTQRATLLVKNVNIYTSTAGVGMYEEGKQSSGEFSDERRGLDWLETEIQFRVFTLLLNARKVPYTAEGMEQIATEIRGALALGESNGLLVVDQSTVTVPKIGTVSSADKGARVLNNVKFQATLQGAIHKVVITGTVTL